MALLPAEVHSAATSTTLGVVPDSTVFGQSLTLTASVTSASGTHTGQVQFFDGTMSVGNGIFDWQRD